MLANKLISVLNVDTVRPYLEFKSDTPMTIRPRYTNSGITLQYSLDSISWINILSGVTTPSANIIYFRGQATGTKTLYTSFNSTNRWVFTGATNLECIGNINYLLQDNLGDIADDIILGSYAYANMFENAISLVTPPQLLSTILGNACYRSMFTNCSSLTIPPKLPALTLSSQCYYGMFYSSGLSTIPYLPSTYLPISCYNQMFYNCINIKLSTTLMGIYDTSYRIPTTGTGTAETSALDNMFTGTGGTFTGTPLINTTYYTENTPV